MDKNYYINDWIEKFLKTIEIEEANSRKTKEKYKKRKKIVKQTLRR